MDLVDQAERSAESRRITELNDAFRTTLTGGKVVVTHGVHELGQDFMDRAMAQVRAFKDFTDENDPHGEHDFGAIEEKGQKLFWKIDYYDAKCEYGSEDPADPEKTMRVLTVMLREEY
jgi:hypothetical protein